MEQKNKKLFVCRYENEPADLKLLLIYVLKRIRFVVYFMLFGALIFASAYYLKTYVLVEEKEYVATGELYLVYADDVRMENIYINDYTWQNLVQTDKAINYAMENIDSAVSEEYLKGVVTAGLVSDVRFVTLKVTTNDPDLSVEIAQAFQGAIVELGKEMVDIESVTVYTEADSAEEVVGDDRTLRMACTGAVIGIILSLFGIVMQYIFDDSVYVISQFERRFGIPVMGICIHSKGNEAAGEKIVGRKSKLDPTRLWGRQAIKVNYRAFSKDCKKIAVADTALRVKSDVAFEILRDAKQKLEQDELLAVAMGDLKEEDVFFASEDYELIKVGSINEDAELVTECAKADGVIIMVPCGAHNGKILERAIDLLIKQNCNIVGALLYDGNASLLKMYYYDALLFGKQSDKEEDSQEEEYSYAD